MIYSPKAFSLLISSIVASLTTIFLSLVKDSNLATYLVAFFISFSSAFFLTYFTLEFFIFREIKKLRSAFEKMKNKEYKALKSKKIFSGDKNLIEQLNQEMSAFAIAKNLEIEQLKKEESFRRDFLADVSHELKTPIFSAQGFINTLLDGAMEDKEVNYKFLKKAAKSLDGLENIVKDLIVISQIESGAIKMQFEFFDIKKLAREIIDQLEEKALKRQTKIVLKSNAKDPIEVQGDAQRIGQVLTNLIDNAIKYGKEKGEIKVRLNKSTNKSKVTISVEDDGPGIKETHLPRIFERFYRIDKSRSRETGGTGLGLAIVKHILEVHKSKINVTSEVGKGTKFTFALKLPKSEE